MLALSGWHANAVARQRHDNGFLDLIVAEAADIGQHIAYRFFKQRAAIWWQ